MTDAKVDELHARSSAALDRQEWWDKLTAIAIAAGAVALVALVVVVVVLASAVASIQDQNRLSECRFRRQSAYLIQIGETVLDGRQHPDQVDGDLKDLRPALEGYQAALDECPS